MADQTNEIDASSRQSLTATSNADGVAIVRLWADPITHRLLVDISGATGTFVTNEIVAGSATTFTLANTPILGSQAIYGAGIRLTPGAGNDYTIVGAVISILSPASYSAGQVLADYRH